MDKSVADAFNVKVCNKIPFKVWKGVTQETVYDCAKYVSRRLDRNPIKVYDKSLRS